jgi:integrase
VGRVYRPKYAYTRADGTRVEKQTEAWYIEYGDASGRWIRRKAGITKEQAQDALRRAESDVLNEKNGLPTRRAADLTCEDLLRAYLDAQRPQVSAKQMVILTQRIGDVLRFVKALYIRQLKPDAVEGCLQALAERGLSARSQNGYLQAVKGMLNWAVRNRKLPYNPLSCVPSRPEIEKRRVRRALTEDEIARLLVTAQGGPLRRRLRMYQNRPRNDGTYKPVRVPLTIQAKMADEGRHIVLIYRIMLETGLRKNEVRQLAWADLDLENGTLTTRPEWEGNKSGRCETLPLPPGLIKALTSWRESHPGPDHARVVRVTSRLLRCFDDDLVAAGLARRVALDEAGAPVPPNKEGLPIRTPVSWRIEKRDSAGRQLDLHALRHTCGTRLVAAGVDIKTVQALMRHRSPELTLGIYVHSDRARLREAVGRLPELQGGGAVRGAPGILGTSLPAAQQTAARQARLVQALA